MPKKIASFVNELGNIIPMSQDGHLVIYHKRAGTWVLVQTQGFNFRNVQGMHQLRDCMNDLVDALGDCKTFIGFAVTGVPYFELEKAGVTIWEFEGKTESFLEYVDQQEQINFVEKQLAQAERDQQMTELLPKDIGDGRYMADLTKIQAADLGITSKQILQPLIRKGAYKQIEVVCNHIPPWLAAEITSQSLNGEAFPIDHKLIKLVISKQHP